MKENYILLGVDGKENNVIKIKPPMCFNKENADSLIKQMELSILKFYKNHSKL